MQITLRPLLARTALKPDEFLLSLVDRLSYLNDYSPPAMLERLIREDLRRPGRISDGLEFPVRTETYNKLAALTIIDPLTLYKSTSHRFAPLLTPPPNIVRSLQLPCNVSVPRLPIARGFVQIRQQRYAQFCPLCLKDDTYHRLHWIPVAISACLRHRCLLVDRCQACGADISVHAVVRAQCRRCRADLTKVDAFSVVDDDEGLRAQRIIQAWFMENASPGGASLPEQLPAVLYRIVDGLQYCIGSLNDWGWPYLHRIEPKQPTAATITQYGDAGQRSTVYENYRLYTTAFRGLMDWPNSFYDFLENFRKKYTLHAPSAHKFQETGELVSGSIFQNLGPLYMPWLRRYWASPAYGFLQEAFKRHIAENYLLESSPERTHFRRQDPVLAERLEHLTISEACHLLKTSPRTVELLLKNGQLTDRSSVGSTHLLLDRKEVLYLNTVWLDPLPEKQAAIFLGVTQELVGDLIETGLLSSRQRSPHQAVDEQITRASVIGCLERMSLCTKGLSPQDLAEENAWLSLAEAVQLLSARGFDAVTLFLLAISGTLWAYQPLSLSFQLGSLHFARTDLQVCLDKVNVNGALVSRGTAAKFMEIREVVLSKLVRGGFISPKVVRQHLQYFDRASLDHFMSENLTGEAMMILGIEETARQKWIVRNFPGAESQ